MTVTQRTTLSDFAAVESGRLSDRVAAWGPAFGTSLWRGIRGGPLGLTSEPEGVHRSSAEPLSSPTAPYAPAPKYDVPPTAGNPPTAERLRLSQRVILHIYAQGRLHDGEVATPAFTQAGMSEKLGVGQSPLSNVLRRLVVGGVLTEDVRHVFGRPRRLRVYRLTPMGESLALELRRRSGPPAAPAGPPTGMQRL